MQIKGDASILGTLTLSGNTVSGNTSLMLDNSAANGFSSSTFTFLHGGRFMAGEVNVLGTNDVFFQALPATGAGYGYLEAWNGAGMVLGTGNSTPVLIRPNRTTVVTVTTTQITLGSSSTQKIVCTGTLLPRVIANTSATGNAGEIAWSTADSKFAYCTTNGGTFTLFSSGSGGTPGGSTTQLQYNNAGAFGGTAGLTWDSASTILELTGTFECPNLVALGDMTIYAQYNGGATGYLYLQADLGAVIETTLYMNSNTLYLDSSSSNISWLSSDGSGTLEIHSDTGGGTGNIQLYADQGLGGSIGLNTDTINLTAPTVNVGNSTATVNIGSKAKVDSKGVIYSSTPAQQIYQALNFGGF